MELNSQRSNTDLNPDRKLKQCQVWEPLSLSAVGEYSARVQAIGAGVFNQGRTPVWATAGQVTVR